MANPQTEHGYTRVANELLEAVLLADLGKREQKVVWAVIRMTYGYNKKEDAVSTHQIAQLTGLDRSHVTRCLRGLVGSGVIKSRPSSIRRHGVNVPLLCVNKDYSEWQTGAKAAPVQTANTGDESAPVEGVQTGAESAPVEPEETGAELARVPKQHGCQNSTPDGCQIGSQTGAKTAPSKDNPKDRKDRGKSAPRESVPCPEGVSESVWADWLKHRKSLRAPLNQSAWDRMEPELRKAQLDGWTPDDALAEAMAAGWRGLRAEWLRNRMASNSRSTRSEQNDQAGDEFLRRIGASNA